MGWSFELLDLTESELLGLDSFLLRKWFDSFGGWFPPVSQKLWLGWFALRFRDGTHGRRGDCGFGHLW
jgi:hypothetical protein